jgi:hypothetical protein
MSRLSKMTAGRLRRRREHRDRLRLKNARSRTEFGLLVRSMDLSWKQKMLLQRTLSLLQSIKLLFQSVERLKNGQFRHRRSTVVLPARSMEGPRKQKMLLQRTFVLSQRTKTLSKSIESLGNGQFWHVESVLNLGDTSMDLVRKEKLLLQSTKLLLQSTKLLLQRKKCSCRAESALSERQTALAEENLLAKGQFVFSDPTVRGLQRRGLPGSVPALGETLNQLLPSVGGLRHHVPHPVDGDLVRERIRHRSRRYR